MASRAVKVDPKPVASGDVDTYVEPVVVRTLDKAEIAALAYELWQERGCPIGSDQEDWFNAESELKSKLGLPAM